MLETPCLSVVNGQQLLCFKIPENTKVGRPAGILTTTATCCKHILAVTEYGGHQTYSSIYGASNSSLQLLPSATAGV